MLHRSSQILRRLGLMRLLIALTIFSGCVDSSEHTSVSQEDATIEIVMTYEADVPALGYRQRAMITQGIGEYVGVDDWRDSDPVPPGTKLVNGGTSASYSADFSDRSITAYSNYFTTEKTRDDALAGGLLDASRFNGLVEVGPWRADGTTGHFTYRRYGVTYDVMRPLPVASAVCRNNPQMDTEGTGGAVQYFAPFIRQDLIRLGYVRISGVVDSWEASRISSLPRYVALYSRTTTLDELSASALENYSGQMAARTRSEQEQAAQLRSTAITLRAEKKRSNATFTARATAGDLSLAADRRIDGFARVGLVAAGDIVLAGVIWGSDRISSQAGNHCLVGTGALVETWTDRIPAGSESISFACRSLAVEGRVQTQAAPWSSWSQGTPGKIVLSAAGADPAATGLSIGEGGQVLALLQTPQSDASLNAVRMTSAGGGIDIDGPGYGFNVVADKGTVLVENTGAQGSVTLRNKAALSADRVKACARAADGTVIIYGGAHLDADTLVELIGGAAAGGRVAFRGAGDVIVTSKAEAGAIVISANRVEVETGVRLVTRSWVKSDGVWTRVDQAADVYCNACVWSSAGGGDPTSGYEGTWSVPPRRMGPPAVNACF